MKSVSVPLRESSFVSSVEFSNASGLTCFRERVTGGRRNISTGFLQTLSQIPGYQVHYLLTNQPGRSGLAGVVKD